jgi:Zn finger protein HypA/HybF involved in hydrogenase expression
MKVVAYLMAALVGGLGLLFVIGSQGMAARLVVGGVLVAAALVLVAVVNLRPVIQKRTFEQRLHLSGEVSLADLKCKQCAGALSNDAVSVRAGAVFISCPYCQASYQLHEEATW